MLDPPIIRYYHLPDQEQDAARAIDLNLIRMAQFTKELRAAAQLCDYCDKILPHNQGRDAQDVIIRWHAIAIRDGAMTIYHFGKRWGVMPSLVLHSAFISEHIDRTEFNRVGGLFERAFPQWALVRKGVAHRGDFSKAPNRVRENSVDGVIDAPFLRAEGTGMFVSDYIYNRTYVTTVEQKTAQYELTMDKVLELDAVLQTLYRAFMPVAEALEVLGQLRRPRSDQSPKLD